MNIPFLNASHVMFQKTTPTAVNFSQPKSEKLRLNCGNNCKICAQYDTIQYKTYNAPYVTKMLFVGAEICTIFSLNRSIIIKPYIEALGLKINNTHSPLSNSATMSHQTTQLMNTGILI